MDAARPFSSSAVIGALRDAPDWESAAARLGCSVPAAREAVRARLAACVPPESGEAATPGVEARIVRDAWGVPHVLAGSEAEAYYGLGFAMGQDRLWQLDYLRRAAYGTLAEVLGEAAVETDRTARILGLRRVAEAGAAALAGSDRERLEAFCGGVNLARTRAERDGLPLEFALLEYAPAPWEPVDTLAVLRAFWWQLTGRFPVICVPEFARRLLGDGERLAAFLLREGRGETIWARGVPYPDLPRWSTPVGDGRELAGGAVQDGGAPGSNNWVIGPRRSATGKPLLASDPHVPFAALGQWYEAHLRGGELDAYGGFIVGTPGILFGRNPTVAWGLTNNISSLRDLYVESVDSANPLRYRRGAEWREMTVRRESIAVRGEAPVDVEVREVDHGPVVSALLPVFARTEEVVSVRWVGHEPTPELEVMLAYARAASVPGFREHLRRWACPSFNFVLAGADGEIGYQLTGRLPLRPVAARGFRPGADPAHAWAGFVPYEALPATGDPPEGWLGSANNPAVGPEWPYPLSGQWPGDYRMQRLVQLWNRPGPFTAADMAAGQNDSYSPRAGEWAGPAASALREAGVDDPLLAEVAAWGGAYPPESRPALLFEAFYLEWCRAVLTRRLPESMLPCAFPLSAGLSEGLLAGDTAAWFGGETERRAALRQAWSAARALLTARLGADETAWRWGALHTMTLHHPLACTPLLRELLDRGPVPHAGAWNALNNSQYELERPFASFTGVSYRLLVDFAGATQAVNSSGQSGHPGSPHYDDQLPLWQRGEYRRLDLDPDPPGPEWRLRPG